MKITAAEPERTDGTATGMVFGRYPGPGSGVQVKGAVFNFKAGVGLGHLQGGGKDFVVKGQDGLDHTG